MTKLLVNELVDVDAMECMTERDMMMNMVQMVAVANNSNIHNVFDWVLVFAHCSRTNTICDSWFKKQRQLVRG